MARIPPVPKLLFSARKALRDRRAGEEMGDAEYEKQLVSPIDRTFVVVIGAIMVIFAAVAFGATWLGI